MFMYANSGQNKLNVNEKEKKPYSYIYYRKEPCVKTILMHIYIFIKNDVRMLKLFLTLAARNSSVFVSWFK